MTTTTTFAWISWHCPLQVSRQDVGSTDAVVPARNNLGAADVETNSQPTGQVTRLRPGQLLGCARLVLLPAVRGSNQVVILTSQKLRKWTPTTNCWICLVVVLAALLCSAVWFEFACFSTCCCWRKLEQRTARNANGCCQPVAGLSIWVHLNICSWPVLALFAPFASNNNNNNNSAHLKLT